MFPNDKKTEYSNYSKLTENKNKHNFLKLKVGICGATETEICGVQAYDIAKELGHEIIQQGGIVVTGATTGFPMWSAIGAKEERGVSIGISPAANEKEHTEVYRLPLSYMDFIIYTGFGFSGANLLFARSCDAIIVGCGRVGTISEFTIAFEAGKPVGVLEGEWSTSDTIRKIVERSNKSNNQIIFGRDIKILVKKVIELAEQNRNE